MLGKGSKYMWMLKKNKGVSFFHKAEPKKKKKNAFSKQLEPTASGKVQQYGLRKILDKMWNAFHVLASVVQKLICARKGLLFLMVVACRRSFLSWSCRCVLSLWTNAQTGEILLPHALCCLFLIKVGWHRGRRAALNHYMDLLPAQISFQSAH